jgi:hypothetical protein
MPNLKADAIAISERMGRDDAIKALIAASREMLIVWEGVAHPTLAYREGSPAWRIRCALEDLS